MEKGQSLKNEVYSVMLVDEWIRTSEIIQCITDFFTDKEPNRSINPDDTVAYSTVV
jgi:molecular chaperone DnaK (HSP70)